MKNNIIILLISTLLLSCSSSKLLEQWKDPNTIDFESNKVLVIGITKNEETRRQFETSLSSELENRGVIAIKSIDFFEKNFTTTKQTEEDLNAVENNLIEAGFDAILLSKVISSEDKITFIKAYNNVNHDFNNFKEDYYQNQEIFYHNEQYEKSKIYHTETALYCICKGKERELLWKASIDITNPYKAERTIQSYVKLLAQELRKQQLLIL